ncbi:hypothetical protein L3Q82_017957 [Scortum barcoo]|uniref:Uncharacterized protein n=1 Tax=Scortum barcoo TaxID=214431 RepID=A0ACB8VHI8_9TELE|nr:hypothetical protein L3Q82_017957 [Scortum barcoo]
MASAGAPPGPGATHLATKVELTISCENLMDMDVFSKSDPLCALYINTSGNHWYEFGRTEMILNCLNPKFSKKFVIDYYFEMVQRLKFCVYDIDNNTYDLSDDDFLGELECTLGQIVSNRQMTRALLLKDKRPAGHGTITISAEEITDTRVTSIEVSGRKLDKKYLWWSDPFLEFFKQTETGWQLAHRTEVVNNNLNPIWRPFRVSLRSLCGGDVEKPIKVDCYDHHFNGSHDLIGSFKTTFAEMQVGTHVSPAEFECINPNKLKKKNYKNSGIICFKHCQFTLCLPFQVVKEYTFLDYIMGGCQINFTIAIDFTGSNGDPTTPQSLHYINPEGYNEYLTAIWAVGSVIQDYDSNKMFPVFGFGAQIPPTWHVSHEFPINFNPSNPFCAGIEGVVTAYQQCLPQVKLWGPTNFSPVIRHVACFARQALRQSMASQYYVLLIITDGVITDMDQTRTAIVEASRLPMSIIIVGVGGADFSAMEFLDSDDKLLHSPSGDVAFRDIVQFVPFRDFQAVMAAVGNVGSRLTDCVTKVALSISCDNLLDRDTFSKSDPLCVLLMNSSGPHWCEIGRTEKIDNCLNPKFSKAIVVDYYFEMVQKLKFEVYDIDSENCSLQDADFLGEMECTLGQVVSSRKLTRPLVMKDRSPAGKGTITICAEEITDNRVVAFEVSARKLDKKDFFGKSDPFLEFYKQTGTGWQLAHRTEVVKNNLNPVWKPFRIPMQSLCGGDVEKSIKVDCYDYNNSGSHDFIGSFETTLAQIQQASQTYAAEFECINSKKKQKKKGYKNSGVIIVKQCKIVKEYTFLDYIMGGCQINFTCIFRISFVQKPLL